MKTAPKNGMLPAIILLSTPTFWVVCHAQFTKAGGQMETFRLSGSGLLKGFVAAKPTPNEFGPLFEKPPHATGVLNARFFHGRSELRYSVLLFPHQNALRAWDKQMSSTAPGWFSPLRSPKDGQGVRRMNLGGENHPGWPRPTAINVNRVLIAIYPYQHGITASGALPNKEFVRLIERIKAELIGRAKRLPANKK